MIPFKDIIGFIFPDKCPVCGEFSGKDGICIGCRNELDGKLYPHTIWAPFFGKSVFRAVSLFPYDEEDVRNMLFSVKLRGNRSAVSYFSAKAADEIILSKELSSCDAITYVPRRKRAERENGWDQGKLYTDELSCLTGIKSYSFLKRKPFRISKEQKGLTKSEREENVKDAFCVKGDVTGKRILLFDDVVTTGASAGECARVLLKAGAKRVYVVCIASKL